MAVKDILVYLDNDKGCDKRVQAAADLCIHFEAHLSGLYVTRSIDIPGYARAQIPNEVLEANKKYFAGLRKEAHAVFTGNADAKGIGGEFRSAVGDINDQLNTLSRYVDLLLVPQQPETEHNLNSRYRVPDILFGAACPVMVLPEGEIPTQPPRRVLIAWDGGRECARALNAALPLLTEVEKVQVLAVGVEGADAADITLHIHRHGIGSEVVVIDGSSHHAGDTLLAQARAMESELLVMGAYGHSRLREFVLGGTTEQVLAKAHLPVLFSH